MNDKKQKKNAWLSLRISPELQKKIKMQALIEDKTIQTFVIEIIQEKMNKI